jgi:hypothetical protein
MGTGEFVVMDVEERSRENDRKQTQEEESRVRIQFIIAVPRTKRIVMASLPF